MKGKAFLWADVFEALDLQNKPDILVQLLDFMKTHGLSPGKPIELASMVAFIQSAGFVSSLQHSANKLNDDFEWDFFPRGIEMPKARRNKPMGTACNRIRDTGLETDDYGRLPN